MIELLRGVLVFIAPFVWDEVKEWMPTLAKRLVSRTVSVLPEHSRERMHEEWIAEVAQIPGKIGPLLFACSLWWGYKRIGLGQRLDLHLSRCVLRLADLSIASALAVTGLPTQLMVFVVTSISCGRIGMQLTPCVGMMGKPFHLMTYQIVHCKTGCVTRCGRIVHALGLDVQPMIFNVLRGDMSMIGPPPTSFDEDGAIYAIRPGMCGLYRGRRLDGFGFSTLATMRIYFGSLWSSFRVCVPTLLPQ